jgi:hypothetical protein
VQHLPGVGENFQDHVGFGCVWEYPRPLPPRNNMGEATFFWKSDPDLDTPDLYTCQGEVPICSPETAAQFNPPPGSWTLYAGLVRPNPEQTGAQVVALALWFSKLSESLGACGVLVSYRQDTHLPCCPRSHTAGRARVARPETPIELQLLRGPLIVKVSFACRAESVMLPL